MSLASSSLFWSSALDTPVFVADLLLQDTSAGGGSWRWSPIVIMYASLWGICCFWGCGTPSGSFCLVKAQKTESWPAAPRLPSRVTACPSASMAGGLLCCKNGVFSFSAFPPECTILMGTFLTAELWFSITCSILKKRERRKFPLRQEENVLLWFSQPWADLKFHCMMAEEIFSMPSVLRYPRPLDSSHHFLWYCTVISLLQMISIRSESRKWTNSFMFGA